MSDPIDSQLYYRITDLPAAQPITGTEVVEAIQDGKNVKFTLEQLMVAGPQGEPGVDGTLTPEGLAAVQAAIDAAAAASASAGTATNAVTEISAAITNFWNNTGIEGVEYFRGIGFTDAETIQAAVDSGKALSFPAREYVINTGETIINTACHVMIGNNTTFKIADGAIVNTDANRRNFTAFMQVRGVQGFVMMGTWNIDGNRDNQTYPTSTSDFGRGTATLAAAGRRTNGVIEFVPGADNLTPCRGIVLDGVVQRNGYLNGFVFWQVEGVFCRNVRTSNNTINGFAGGGCTNFYEISCHHYRDGASDAFPTTQGATGYGDRAGTQFREIQPSYNAAALGMPMIPIGANAQINRNINILSSSGDECGVESWFLRGCFPGRILNCHSKNVGYKRLANPVPENEWFAPAHYWCEMGWYEIEDFTAHQTNPPQAGWMKPVVGVVYPFSGIGKGSTPNPMDIDGDFRSSVRSIKGVCGLDASQVKQNNFGKGLLLSSHLYFDDIDLEGLSDDPITITNDANFNTQPPQYVTGRRIKVRNAQADRVIVIKRYQPTGVTISGSADNIDIDGVEAFDIRSSKVGTDDHAMIDVDATMQTYNMNNLSLTNLDFDCANTGGNFNGVRLRCNVGSANVRVHFKRVKTPLTALRTQGFRNLEYEGNIDSAYRVLLVDQGSSGANIESLRIRLNTYDITTEFFNFMNMSTRKINVLRVEDCDLNGRIGCKTFAAGSITTTPDSFFSEVNKFFWRNNHENYGSANPSVNVQDMRRTFSGATPLGGATPFYLGEIVRRTDTGNAYMAKGVSIGDWALLA